VGNYYFIYLFILDLTTLVEFKIPHAADA